MVEDKGCTWWVALTLPAQRLLALARLLASTTSAHIRLLRNANAALNSACLTRTLLKTSGVAYKLL